jgi:hypothetical protein
MASVGGLRTNSSELVDYPFCAANGGFALAGRSSQDTITGSLSGGYCLADKFTVTGGTGRYSGATGSGTVTFTCKEKQHYKDKWTGTISY